jgi:hypothetical protein
MVTIRIRRADLTGPASEPDLAAVGTAVTADSRP